MVFSLSRWSDDTIGAELCFYALLLELIITVLIANGFFVTDTQIILDLGELVFNSVHFTLQLLLCYDSLSAFFFSILTIALLVCFYFLIEYFEYDAHASNIVLLSALFSQLAFCFFTSYDLFLIIFFWEAISIVSFLLVQHWSHRLCTYKAGLKVFTISQFGDLPLLLFIFITLSRFQTTNLFEILTVTPLFSFEFVYFSGLYVNVVALLCVLLSFTVFLKAAQFFFYPWLLDAMEAPVPISAQLHSSTLVIIGFYMFYRFQIMFLLTTTFATVYLWFGVCTVVGASVLAFYQIDGKRLLACSTASQLGYIVVSLGLGLYEEAFTLLIFCCCNKALTFVWFGVIMHKSYGLSDFRFLSGTVTNSWLAHSGLAIALANFTIIPGAFSWHAKSLFIVGESPLQPVGAFFGLEVLQLTWFFSSLYLVCLYLMLYLKPNQGAFKRITAPLTFFTKNVLFQRQNLTTVSTAFCVVTVLVVVVLVTPIYTLLLSIVDISIFSFNFIGFFSYF